jgi:hypothetical protein
MIGNSLWRNNDLITRKELLFVATGGRLPQQCCNPDMLNFHGD